MTKTEKSNEIDTISEEYRKFAPLYQRLVDEVIFVLNETLRDTEAKVVSIHGRSKTLDSLGEKIHRKGYNFQLCEVTDLAGVRVVCYYEPDIEIVGNIIKQRFYVNEYIDKSGNLGVDRMGYNGVHYVVSLGTNYSGSRYEGITNLICEIQVRTVLQDAWALISHHLVYKDEVAIPQRLRRDLNNVASLLEIAQGVFDSVSEKRTLYLREIEGKRSVLPEFLSQPVDFDTLLSYTMWKFPQLTVSMHWHTQLLHDLDVSKYQTLADIDAAVNAAHQAVEMYSRENPSWFQSGTDFITKSLGFVDLDFRGRHPWGKKTITAFNKFEHLVKKVA